MSDLQIAVVAHKRPKYLRVMLESLFAVRGVEDHKVSIHVDGGIVPALRLSHTAIFDDFPVDQLIVHKDNRGNLHSIVGVIKHCVDDGADEVLYLEEDMVVRPDTLEYLAGVPRDSQFYSLFGTSARRDSVYCPMGNMVSRDTFLDLYDWVKQKQYVGEERPGMGYPLGEEPGSHDAVFYAFMVKYGLKTRFPGRSYTAHFGLIGYNSGKPSEADLAFERYMFSGTRDTWLPRVVSILENRDSIPADVTATQFLPSHFRYEEAE